MAAKVHSEVRPRRAGTGGQLLPPSVAPSLSTDLIQPLPPGTNSFVSSKDHRVGFTSPLTKKSGIRTGPAGDLHIPERGTGSVFILQQVGISDTAKSPSASLLTESECAESWPGARTGLGC